MKILLFLFAFVLIANQPAYSQSSTTKSNVFICNSKTATRYHSYKCNGLNACTHSIAEITKQEAIDLGKTPCKICYSDSGSSGSSSPAPKSLAPTPSTPSAPKATPAPKSSGSGCQAVQCSGITKAGARCKNRTTNCSGRCYHHG